MSTEKNRTCFSIVDKGKGKVRPRTGHESPEVKQRYSSPVSLTSALDGGGLSTPRPGRFTLGKTRYLLYRWLGGPQGQSGKLCKISPPPSGFDSRTVQPVPSRYTICTVVGAGEINVACCMESDRRAHTQCQVAVSPK
jgi:hypothetical protein